MATWLFTQEEIEKAPSIQKGCSPEEERNWRSEGVKIILKVGEELKLKKNPTLATAALFFHRFYMRYTFQDYKLEFIALGSLFLAGKVEDTPKKVNHIVAEASKLETFKQFTPTFILEEVMGVERVLLQALEFDIMVEHPYKFLSDYVKHLESTHLLQWSQEEKNEFFQMTWAFVNDSIHTTLCIEWEPQVIAIAMIRLTCEFKQLELPADWYQRWVQGLPSEMLDTICHRIIDFYTESKKSAAEEAEGE